MPFKVSFKVNETDEEKLLFVTLYKQRLLEMIESLPFGDELNATLIIKGITNDQYGAIANQIVKNEDVKPRLILPR